jgi:hypothetical protein
MKRRYLIGQLACFGDCLYATAIAKQIKSDYPDSHITWAIASKYKSILELNPHIDEIWEIPLADGDYAGDSWNKFEREAIRRKDAGVYDELVFSQLPHKNWHNFDGTIRSSILRSYGKPITVSVAPVIKLSVQEVENVRKYAEKHSLNSFKEVILFECVPGSGQSSVSVEFACEVAKRVTDLHQNVCFILSSHKTIVSNTKQIIDASALTFRENAELSKYCTLLIGCSSGITWLCTSEWSKKLNSMQIINKNAFPFAGVAYDFKLWNMDSRHILEIHDKSKEKLNEILDFYFTKGFADTRRVYDQELELTAGSFKTLAYILWLHSRKISSFRNVYHNTLQANRHIRPIGLFIAFIYGFSISIIRSVLFPKGSWSYRLAKKYFAKHKVKSN